MHASMAKRASSPELLDRLAEARKEPARLRTLVADARPGVTGARLDAEVASVRALIDALLDGTSAMGPQGAVQHAEVQVTSARARDDGQRRLMKFWREFQVLKASGESSGSLPRLEGPVLRALELYATLRSEDRPYGPTVHDVAERMNVSAEVVKGYRRELLRLSEYDVTPELKPAVVERRPVRPQPFRERPRRSTACARDFLRAVHAAGEQGEDLFVAFARLAGEASGRCAYCGTPLLDRATEYGCTSCKVLATRQRPGKLIRQPKRTK
jgi:hypothetical protein